MSLFVIGNFSRDVEFKTVQLVIENSCSNELPHRGYLVLREGGFRTAEGVCRSPCGQWCVDTEAAERWLSAARGACSPSVRVCLLLTVLLWLTATPCTVEPVATANGAPHTNNRTDPAFSCSNQLVPIDHSLSQDQYPRRQLTGGRQRLECMRRKRTSQRRLWNESLSV